MHIDDSFRRNGPRGFVQTLSLSRAPGDAPALAYTAERIAAKASLKTEFAAVSDIALAEQNEREPVRLDHFAVWVRKLKPTMQ